ncbi:hypothetical protein [Cryobacterium sp.]|nr:hypothetical protein [Cryobacterium sp.]
MPWKSRAGYVYTWSTGAGSAMGWCPRGTARSLSDRAASVSVN